MKRQEQASSSITQGQTVLAPGPTGLSLATMGADGVPVQVPQQTGSSPTGSSSSSSGEAEDYAPSMNSASGKSVGLAAVAVVVGMMYAGLA